MENWICPFLQTRNVCLCKRMLEALEHTSSVSWVRRKRGDKKRKFWWFSPVIAWPDFLLCEHWEMGGGVERRRCSVQVVQLFLLYFSPESVPVLGASECLWCPSCRCEAELPEKKEMAPNPGHWLMSWLKRKAFMRGLGGTMFWKVKWSVLAARCVRLLSARRHSWGSGRVAAPAGVWKSTAYCG